MGMNVKMDDLGAFGIIVGLIGAGWGLYQTKKSGDLAKKLDISLTDLEKKTSVDISEDVVNKAMNNAVERQVRSMVAETAENVRGDIRKEIKTRVHKEVDENLDSIHDGVEEKIDEMIAGIDEEKFVNDMKADAKKAMLAKYNGALDGVLGDFKDRFKDLNGIWNYVANCAAPRGYNGNYPPRFFDFGGNA